MRNIAEIIDDDRNGKQLSQTERQIAVAYIQGKYDAVRELKIGNNSKIMEVLDKIRAEIEQIKSIMNDEIINHNRKDLINFVNGLNQSLNVIDKYKAEMENP